ncbi:glycosyltransferase [Sporofaciens musculi]|uniref:glycosyltransferase n=1 Tax=Sporofaciens musculi TaxID=2681861 RepID=UPI0025882612|nr:glycosyltransferase [Sporofaciens musculi]
MTFSIIIPVYNVEAYLDECLNSVLRQNYGKTEYEIILVDDGSADVSGKLCDEYAAKHENIVSVHQENQGLSGARNTGIRCAKGNYLVFLDSDDIFYKDSLVHLQECLDGEPDVIVCNSMKFEGNADNLEKYNYLSNDSGLMFDVLNEYQGLLNHKDFTMTAWSLVVRREFLVYNNLFFEPGILHEDDLWSHMIMTRAGSMSYNRNFLCCYRVNREASIMQVLSYRHTESYLIILNKLDLQKERAGISRLERAVTFRKMALIYITLCYNAADYIDTEKKDSLCAVIKRYSYLLKYEEFKFSVVFRLFQKIFGVYGSEMMIRKFKNR